MFDKFLGTFSSANAKLNRIHCGFRKVHSIANLIKNLDVGQAVKQLKFSNKKAAAIVLGVLNSAIANAENNHMLNVDRLFVSKVLVGRDKELKRFSPRGRGRSASIKKRYTNLTIVVSEV